MSLVSQNRPELILYSFIHWQLVAISIQIQALIWLFQCHLLEKFIFFLKEGASDDVITYSFLIMTFFVLSPKKLQSSDFKFLFFISIFWVILNKVEIFLPFSPIEFSRPGENCFHWVFIAPTLPLLQGRRISLSSVYPPPPPWINWLQDNDQDQNLQSQAPLI